jgi:hypothetical protein
MLIVGALRRLFLFSAVLTAKGLRRIAELQF